MNIDAKQPSPIRVLQATQKSVLSLLLLVAFVAGVPSHAAETQRLTAQQWRAVEITLQSSKAYKAPFYDVRVDADFTGADGTVISRPAFWDGGNTWRIRFAPPKVGVWKMTTRASDAENGSLNGVEATIDCGPYQGDLAIYKHGFVKVADGGRYFAYADGTPFFYLGDTHWLVSHERFSTSNAPGVASEFKYIVDKRVEQGFTVYQTEPIQDPHTGKHTGTDEEPVYDLADGVSEEDMAGFRNLDRKFQYVADKGLVNAEAMIVFTMDIAQNPQKYTLDYMKLLGRYWAARYGAYPVLWTVAQEVDPHMYGELNDEATAKWKAAAQALTEADGYRHPLSAHMEVVPYGTPASSTWGALPFHSWWAVQWSGPFKGGIFGPSVFAESKPAKPVVEYESFYEGLWSDSYGVRTTAYFAFQSGMCGFGYGANGVWNDLYTRDGDWGTDYEMPQRYMNWYEGANLEGARQLGFLKEFYTSLNWWRLKPMSTEDEHSPIVLDREFTAAMSTDDSGTIVIYFYEQNRATGKFRGLLPGTQYRVRWFDPRTGKYTELGPISATNGEWRIPEKPSAEDWILIAEKQKQQ